MSREIGKIINAAWREAWNTQDDLNSQPETPPLDLFDLKDPRNNNIPFTWEDEPAVPHDPETLRTAFQLAGRPDIAAQIDLDPETPSLQYPSPADYFYITDVAQGGHNRNSTSLWNKYGADTLLQPGKTYYLCQI